MGVWMKSQQYKTIGPAAAIGGQKAAGAPSAIPGPMSDLTSVLHALSTRLERMESRLDAIEQQLSRTPTAPQPPGAWPEQPHIVGEARRQVPPSSHASPSGLSVYPSSSPSQISSASREMLLAPADEQIVSALRSRGTLCAEQVRVIFGYKGKNAASSRLNRLYELGILEKQQAGRVVYYRMK
jgi:hypothetical protein